MESFSKKIDIRWADLDPNFHVLHSRYYDFGAYCRMAFLTEHGLSSEVMMQHHIGPILFREECFFKREIRFGDDISIDLKLSKINADFSRWTMEHQVWKNGTKLSAVMNVDIAWLDTKIRKLTVPPPIVKDIYELIPRTDNFEMIMEK